MRYIGIALVIVVLLMLAGCNNPSTDQVEPDLLSEKVSAELLAAIENTNKSSLHVMIEFNENLNSTEQKEFDRYGAELLSYKSSKKWNVKLNISRVSDIVQYPKLKKISSIQIDDKLHFRIRDGIYSDWMKHEDGYISVEVDFFDDVSEERAQEIFNKYAAEPEYRGATLGYGPDPYDNDYTIKLPAENIKSIASEDDVNYITETSAPASVTTTDGERLMNEGSNAKKNVLLILSKKVYNLDTLNEFGVTIYNNGEKSIIYSEASNGFISALYIYDNDGWQAINWGGFLIDKSLQPVSDYQLESKSNKSYHFSWDWFGNLDVGLYMIKLDYIEVNDDKSRYDSAYTYFEIK